jgi:WD40 repeat protein
MKISADEKNLFLRDGSNRLRLISLTDGTTTKDFGRIHDHLISGIVVTADEKFFFTSSVDGKLIQWNYGDTSLVRVYKQITGGIISLCL